MTGPQADVVSAPPPGHADGRLGRRAFLGVALAGVATVGAAALGWRAVGGRARRAGRLAGNYAQTYLDAWLPADERILRHFSYLRIDRREVRRFVADFERRYGPVRRGDRGVSWGLYNAFLMSTDFLQHGADERRPVRYVLLYDPYAAPCWNPMVPTVRA